MAEMYSGTCFCGAVAIEASGEPVEMGYCHCHSCRHYSGAPLVAFTLWRADQITVSRGAELLGRF
ncbi:MAG TPA: GFA family protein, partial [Rhodospirillales bacterium]|nr:GFA family protein [Rhodospirillales bacterium]